MCVGIPFGIKKHFRAIFCNVTWFVDCVFHPAPYNLSGALQLIPPATELFLGGAEGVMLPSSRIPRRHVHGYWSDSFDKHQ
jgi:hypothetical protein